MPHEPKLFSFNTSASLKTKSNYFQRKKENGCIVEILKYMHMTQRAVFCDLLFAQNTSSRVSLKRTINNFLKRLSHLSITCLYSSVQSSGSWTVPNCVFTSRKRTPETVTPDQTGTKEKRKQNYLSK